MVNPLLNDLQGWDMITSINRASRVEKLSRSQREASQLVIRGKVELPGLCLSDKKSKKTKRSFQPFSCADT